MTWAALSDCIIDCCQNWFFLKLWRFEYYEEFKIWLSLFCRVLLLALFFSYLFLFRVYFVVTHDITILPASSVCVTDCCQNWSFKSSGEFSKTNSLKFGFSLFCWVLHVAYFFLPVFTSCSFVFFVFFSQQLLTIEKRLAIIFDRQQISLKRPIMQLNKVHHGKCRRQNRNKMDEDRRRKLTANHQHFNNWIKHLVGLE